MPTTSNLEKELVKATKTDMSGSRQTALKSLVDNASDLSEKAWDKLSEEAQVWVNAGIKASNSKKEIKDFESPAPEDDDADKEEEADKEEDEEVEGEEDEDEENEEEKEEENEEDEEKPRQTEDDDTERDDDVAEDEDNAREKKKVTAKGSTAKKKATLPKKTSVKKKVTAKGSTAKKKATLPEKTSAKKSGLGFPLEKSGVKYQIKRFMMKKPDISVEDLQEKLANVGTKCTPMTVQQIRAEFRHSLRFLKMEGHLPNILIN